MEVLKAGVNATRITVHSDKGHDSFLLEAHLYGPIPAGGAAADAATERSSRTGTMDRREDFHGGTETRS